MLLLLPRLVEIAAPDLVVQTLKREKRQFHKVMTFVGPPLVRLTWWYKQQQKAQAGQSKLWQKRGLVVVSSS